MAAKKTKPDPKPASRSSFDRFARLGATPGVTKSAPAFPARALVIPCDPEHPEHASHNPWRYARENPVIQRWMKQIEAADGELLQDPKGSTIVGFPSRVYISDGGCRIAAIRYLNEDRAVRGESEYEVNVRVTFNDTLAAFRQKHTAANLERQPDDAVTQAKKARQMLEGDDANKVEPVAPEQVCEAFGWSDAYLAAVVDERAGLVALSERWQEAVAQGVASEKVALAAARLAAEAGEEADARHAVQDDLLGLAEASGRRLTPALLKALAKGDEAPPPKPKAERITTADRGALGKILGALSVAWIRDTTELPDAEVRALLGKFGVVVEIDAPVAQAVREDPVAAMAGGGSMKIYVASSWRNTRQPAVVAALRAAGHEVYDFRNPAPGNTGFGWRQCDPRPPSEWSVDDYRRVLETPRAQEGFALATGVHREPPSAPRPIPTRTAPPIRRTVSTSSVAASAAVSSGNARRAPTSTRNPVNPTGRFGARDVFVRPPGSAPPSLPPLLWTPQGARFGPSEPSLRRPRATSRTTTMAQRECA